VPAWWVQARLQPVRTGVLSCCRSSCTVKTISLILCDPRRGPSLARHFPRPHRWRELNCR
jgi:hypothetical protein